MVVGLQPLLVVIIINHPHQHQHHHPIVVIIKHDWPCLSFHHFYPYNVYLCWKRMGDLVLDIYIAVLRRSWFIIMEHHEPASAILSYRAYNYPSFNRYLPINHYYQTSLSIISHHYLSVTSINHHQPSVTMIYEHHCPWKNTQHLPFDHTTPGP